MTPMTQSDEIIKRGEDLANVIVRAAEEQVTKAQTNLDRAKSIAEIILSQAHDAARRVDELTSTHHAGTEKILEGYRIIEGPVPEPAPDSIQWRHDSRDSRTRERVTFGVENLDKLNASPPSIVDGRR